MYSLWSKLNHFCLNSFDPLRTLSSGSLFSIFLGVASSVSELLVCAILDVFCKTASTETFVEQD